MANTDIPAAYTPDPRGLYGKYNIYRANEDGSDGERITAPSFLLIVKDPNATPAILQYAESVAKENPALASDLRSLILKKADPDGQYDLGRQDLAEMWDSPEKIGLAIDAAKENAWMQFHSEPIRVTDGNGEECAVIVHEYEPGAPMTRDHPGEPGCSYWRFATLKEIAESPASPSPVGVDSAEEGG